MPVENLLKFYQSRYFNRVMTLTDPIKTILGTNIFAYGLLRENGQYFQVSNFAEGSEYYFSNYLFIDNPYTRNPEFLETGFSIIDLPQIAEFDSGQKEMNQKFEFSHVLFFLFKEDGNSHLFHFGKSRRDFNKINDFVENFAIYKQFAKYFMDTWHPYRNEMERFTINLRNEMGSKFDIVDKNVTHKTSITDKEALLQTMGVLDVYPSKILSPREIECLHLLSQGLSCKEVGNLLQLSHRTIETYLNNIKYKTRCDRSSDLFRLFHEWKSYGLF